MTNKDFNEEMTHFLGKCLNTVQSKASVYGGEDRLGQIKELAVLGDKTPESVAYDLMSKHFIALKYMCKQPDGISDDKFFEYLGDIAIYCGIIRTLRIDAEKNIEKEIEAS